ncbi:MAG: hypothetical protein IJU03_00160 [Thermoguttaceae bacterium]|nr:hypothetical protein [Thermoguttaceae bacterium]
MRLIASSQGIKPETIERYAGDVDAVRPQKYVEPTPEEKDEQWNRSARQGFAGMLAKAKNALANGVSTFKL